MQDIFVQFANEEFEMSAEWSQLRIDIVNGSYIRFGNRLGRMLDTFVYEEEEMKTEDQFPSKSVFELYQNRFWMNKLDDNDNLPVLFCYIWDHLPNKVQVMLKNQANFWKVYDGKSPLELWKLVHFVMNADNVDSIGDDCQWTIMDLHCGDCKYVGKTIPTSINERCIVDESNEIESEDDWCEMSYRGHHDVVSLPNNDENGQHSPSEDSSDGYSCDDSVDSETRVKKFALYLKGKMKSRNMQDTPEDTPENDKCAKVIVQRPTRIHSLSTQPKSSKEIVFEEVVTKDLHRSKRNLFSKEEKVCIEMGVAYFGEGKWSKIKEKYAYELKDRTTVNIKDCWRTMKKNSSLNMKKNTK